MHEEERSLHGPLNRDPSREGLLLGYQGGEPHLSVGYRSGILGLSDLLVEPAECRQRPIALFLHDLDLSSEEGFLLLPMGGRLLGERSIELRVPEPATRSLPKPVMLLGQPILPLSTLKVVAHECVQRHHVRAA